MHKAPNRYAVVSVIALVLAIVWLIVAIAARSTATPRIEADASEIVAQLRKSLLP